MPIPLPSEFDAVVPDNCTDATCNPSCAEVRAALLDFPTVLFRFVEGWATNAGGMGQDLKDQICALPCNGGGGGTTSTSTDA